MSGKKKSGIFDNFAGMLLCVLHNSGSADFFRPRLKRTQAALRRPVPIWRIGRSDTKMCQGKGLLPGRVVVPLPFCDDDVTLLLCSFREQNLKGRGILFYGAGVSVGSTVSAAGAGVGVSAGGASSARVFSSTSPLA